MRTTFISSLVFLLSFTTSATLALPSGSFDGSVMMPAFGRPRAAASFPVSSPNANAPLSRPRSFKAPRKVPMPFMHPREVEIQSGERDEEMEGCKESDIHDCFVSHEQERVKERRAEQAKVADALRVVKRTSVHSVHDRQSLSADTNRMQIRRR